MRIYVSLNNRITLIILLISNSNLLAPSGTEKVSLSLSQYIRLWCVESWTQAFQFILLSIVFVPSPWWRFRLVLWEGILQAVVFLRGWGFPQGDCQFHIGRLNVSVVKQYVSLMNCGWHLILFLLPVVSLMPVYLSYAVIYDFGSSLQLHDLKAFLIWRFIIYIEIDRSFLGGWSGACSRFAGIGDRISGLRSFWGAIFTL